MVGQWISHRAKLDSATEGRTHLKHNQTHFVSSPPCSLSFLKSRQAEFKSPLSPFPASSQEMRWSWSQRENHIPLAWASCPQALSWSLKLGHSLIKTHLGGRLATRTGQEKPTLPQISAAAPSQHPPAAHGEKNLDSSKDSWSLLKPSWPWKPKEEWSSPLELGLPAAPSFLKLPLPSFTSPNKGLQIKHNQRRLCSWPLLEKCTGKPGSFP